MHFAGVTQIQTTPYLGFDLAILSLAFTNRVSQMWLPPICPRWGKVETINTLPFKLAQNFLAVDLPDLGFYCSKIVLVKQIHLKLHQAPYQSKTCFSDRDPLPNLTIAI